MPDHVHDLPVCGYAPHSPHAADCAGHGRLVACGEIIAAGHPERGRALCRHEGGPDPEPEFADHVHEPPVCLDGHHESCEGKGELVACGTIIDETSPDFGKVLCRHRVPKNDGCLAVLLSPFKKPDAAGG